MHGEAQPHRKVTDQPEAVTGFHDEHARTVDRGDLVEDIVQCRALARAGWTEQEQMHIHLPTQPVEWIERNAPAAAVEEGDARMSGSLAVYPHRGQIGCMLHKHE